MKSNNKQIAIWLFTGCFLIFGMVVIGGITRLTGSGLSITEWKPIMGAIPPLNDAEWDIAFQKYQQIPQFQKINYHFELSDFKTIFWWEFIHRLLGRLIGIVFIIPFLWFLVKKKFDSVTIKKMLFLFLLGGIQGFLGWFMVSSGLAERTSVSHIRLAIHLMFAFITFAFTFYYGLELIYSEKKEALQNKKLSALNKLVFVVLSIQIIYGAFVAGLHAGKIHNTFPLMSGQVIPTGMNAMQPTWLNIFDNPVTVQFIHRFLAFTLLFLVAWFYVESGKEKLNNFQKKGIHILIAAIGIQFLLGVITVLTQANIVMASVHQIGAFFLFSASIYLLFHFRKAA
ncbi:MAG: COX15/CtaA family protein [Bacteroidia bacterium]|jgi:cytochrome c oxidase assembly protein subunit 15|nr:COX15/CtaA family protein [Bacteroidota bacterium]MBP6427835.1 COX15/CtaA family protein [Bacteroidia bacterium]MBP6657399.1 COX15/CtaA family protein [Bacteroidia bacterium]